MKLAVVKPDHIGDLILSSPAIRALSTVIPDLTLFVASKTLKLGRHLFPHVELRTMDLPHLLKSGGAADLPDIPGIRPRAISASRRGYDSRMGTNLHA